MLGLLALCEAGALTLVVSGVHAVENEKSPHPDRQAHVRDVLRLAGVYALTGAAARRRATLYESLGVRSLDALHLASAVEAGAEYFCTTDDRLLRKGQAADTSGTAVVSPLDLVLRLP